MTNFFSSRCFNRERREHAQSESAAASTSFHRSGEGHHLVRRPKFRNSHAWLPLRRRRESIRTLRNQAVSCIPTHSTFGNNFSHSLYLVTRYELHIRPDNEFTSLSGQIFRLNNLLSGLPRYWIVCTTSLSGPAGFGEQNL